MCLCILCLVQERNKGGPKEGGNPSGTKSEMGYEPATLDETTQEDSVVEAWDQWMASRKNSPVNKSDEAPTLQRKTIRGLKRDMSWVAKEISDQEKGMRASAGRRRRRIALLRRMGRGNRGDLRLASLNSLKERLRGMLRIKLARERSNRTKGARKKAQKEFTRKGPKSLWPKQRGENYANAEEVENFWGRIWGVSGSYEAQHQAVAGWSARIRSLWARAPGDMSESWDAGWRHTVKRMPGWKAPGPDKIHGWWHRVFPKSELPPQKQDVEHNG